MNNGRYCDNCGHELEEREFQGRGQWSYTCEKCGFRYRHESDLPPFEQVKKYLLEKKE